MKLSYGKEKFYKRRYESVWNQKCDSSTFIKKLAYKNLPKVYNYYFDHGVIELHARHN